MKTKNLTIMLTDIKGFTEKTAQSSREQIKSLLKKHNELVPPVIERYKGTVVKTIGDAFLVTFESPTDAVLCGMEIQDVLASFNKDKKDNDRIDIRIAINSGEVSIGDTGDIFGDAVNITSRIESIAEAGEVFFTEAVYLLMNKQEVPSSEIGYRQFKGIPYKIKVYKVLKEDPVKMERAADASDFEETPQKEPKPKAETETKSADTLEEEIKKSIEGPAGIPGMILGMMGKFGMKDIDIDEKGKKIKISKDEIHILNKDGKEVHISKDGIKIRKAKKPDKKQQE